MILRFTQRLKAQGSWHKAFTLRLTPCALCRMISQSRVNTLPDLDKSPTSFSGNVYYPTKKEFLLNKNCGFFLLTNIFYYIIIIFYYREIRND